MKIFFLSILFCEVYFYVRVAVAVCYLLVLSPILLTFGYDGYSSCTRPYRTSKSRSEPPCDFRRQSWCTVPGSAYPWHAVRRFVQENHGLMRRMYGDERHISVLRAEIESNDVEYLGDNEWRLGENAPTRYSSRSPTTETPIKKQKNAPTTADAATTTTVLPQETLSTTYSLPNGDFANLNTTPPSNTTVTVDIGLEQNHTFSLETLQSPHDSSTSALSQETVPTTYSLINEEFVNNAPHFNSSYSSNALKSSNGFQQNHIPSPQTLQSPPRQLSTTTSFSIVSKHSNFTISAVADLTPNEIPDSTLFPEPTAEVDGMETITEQVTDTSTEPTTVEYSPATILKGEGLSKQQDKKKEELPIESQLYQDVRAKEKEPATPMLRLRGVNACPVKEEVVAPFWANNTRGEVLALLNLYPFEQYVHWEKCTFELKQMYCREGCRCEQQYRLHRLLAYDPNNECRGIFSDWFKFPSCCVCRCYDLPIEFQMTSRSPRQPPHWFRVANHS